MTTIPLKIQSDCIKHDHAETLIATIDHFISVRLDKNCAHNKEVRDSALKELEHQWKHQLFGQILKTIQNERRETFQHIASCSWHSMQTIRQIDQSFDRIVNSIPTFFTDER